MVIAFLTKRAKLLLASFFLVSCIMILSPLAVNAALDFKSCHWQWDNYIWTWVCPIEPTVEIVEPVVTSTPKVDPKTCHWVWDDGNWSWSCSYVTETPTPTTTTTEQTPTSTEPIGDEVTTTTPGNENPIDPKTCHWQWDNYVWSWVCDEGVNDPSPMTAVVIMKDVVNDNGGTATVENFNYYLDAIGSSDEEHDFVVLSGATTTVEAGQYQFSETGEAMENYDVSYSENCAEGVVTVAPGTIAVCYVTNNDKADENGGGNGGVISPTSTQPHDLSISAEMAEDRTTYSITISWKTNVPATSRVVWGNYSVTSTEPCPEGTATGTCLYGYEFTTTEDPTMVTDHSVTIGGLSPSHIYYFRPISHASPEEAGIEVIGETYAIPVGGGGSGSSGSGSSGSGSSGVGGNTTTTTPDPAVLGEKITDSDTTTGGSTGESSSSQGGNGEEDFVGGVPKDVLGYSTLPEAGVDYTFYILSLVLAGACFAGAKVMRQQ